MTFWAGVLVGLVTGAVVGVVLGVIAIGLWMLSAWER